MERGGTDLEVDADVVRMESCNGTFQYVLWCDYTQFVQNITHVLCESHTEYSSNGRMLEKMKEEEQRRLTLEI